MIESKELAQMELISTLEPLARKIAQWLKDNEDAPLMSLIASFHRNPQLASMEESLRNFLLHEAMGLYIHAAAPQEQLNA